MIVAQQHNQTNIPKFPDSTKHKYLRYVYLQEFTIPSILLLMRSEIMSYVTSNTKPYNELNTKILSQAIHVILTYVSIQVMKQK